MPRNSAFKIFEIHGRADNRFNTQHTPAFKTK